VSGNQAAHHAPERGKQMNNKDLAISIRILALINSGKTAVEAMREVLGNDITDQFITDLYNGLRAKGGR
jgi:hypothetical protein